LIAQEGKGLRAYYRHWLKSKKVELRIRNHFFGFAFCTADSNERKKDEGRIKK
jgi:hypothetical protein